MDDLVARRRVPEKYTVPTGFLSEACIYFCMPLKTSGSTVPWAEAGGDMPSNAAKVGATSAG